MIAKDLSEDIFFRYNSRFITLLELDEHLILQI
jgi:hypothetical protein